MTGEMYYSKNIRCFGSIVDKQVLETLVIFRKSAALLHK